MSIMPKENNKASWQPIPNKFYEVSVSDIQRYLEEDILGFKIACDWERWTGVTAFMGYLRMRVVINPKDIEVADSSNDYVSHVLQKCAIGRTLNKNVVNALKPFMYPQNMNMLYMEQNRDKLRHLNELGVVGPKLDELIRYSQLSLTGNPDTGRQYYRVYLKPEAILFDGLKNADTDKTDGTLYIRRIYGTKQESFRLLVERVLTDNTVTDDLSVDKIFLLK